MHGPTRPHRDQVRLIAKRILRYGAVGNFLVRDIKSEPNSFGLSIRLKDGTLGNYMIKNSAQGFVIRGTQKYFTTLSGLIDYYSVKRRPGLGVQLSENDKFRDENFDDTGLDADEDEEQDDMQAAQAHSFRVERKMGESSQQWSGKQQSLALGNPNANPRSAGAPLSGSSKHFYR